MYHRLLIPLDGSELAEQALAQVEHVAADGAHITLLQIIQPPLPVIAAEMAVPLPTVSSEELRQEAETYLQTVASRLRDRPLAVQVAVVEGDAVAETIVQYARDHGHDLILMSTHGRGGLSRLVFGSVAEAVVRHAPCPVLIVRPQAKGER